MATLDVQGRLPGNEVMVVGDRTTGSTTATGTYTTAALSDTAGISGASRKVVTTRGSG